MPRSQVFGWVIPAAVLLFFSASPVAAGVGVWTSQGPEGGNTQDLVVTRGQPTVLYAGVLQGVYKSVDGGESWLRISQAIPSQILSLAGDPSDPQTLYVGTTTSGDTSISGVFKTSNGGRTWQHLSLGNLIVTALAISPARPTTVWAGTTGGVYVSRDAGTTWSLVTGLPRKFFMALEVHPKRGGTVYATGPGGLFKTVDGGAGWRRLGRDLGANGPDVVALDPVHPERIYIGGQFYAGVFWSADGGSHWQRPETVISPYPVRALAVDPISSIVYAAPWSAPQRVYKSLDGGASWIPAGRGLPGGFVLSLVVDPNHRSVLYAGSLAGVWRSTNRGSSWSPASHGIRHTSVRGIAIDPAKPGTVFATADYAGVFKSTDRGVTWRLLGSGLQADLIQAVAVAPSALYAGTDRGVFRSTDGGGSWRRLTNGPAGSVRSLALSPSGVLYAATDGGAFRSVDRGETWTSIWPPGPNEEVRRIVVSPARSADLYLTAPSGLYLSSDGGDTWTRANLAITPFAVAVDPVRPSIVYVSPGGEGVFKSFDSGLNWEPANFGLPGATVTDIAIDPLHPDTVYAGTYFGIYRSLDGGAHWALFGNGGGTVPNKVQAVAIEPRGALTLYAGTGENGAYERRLSEP